MFHAPKSAFSSAQEFMSPTNEAAEVPPPIPVARGEDRLTDDYCRDGMVVFEIEDIFFRVPKCLFEPGPGKFKPLLFGEREEGKASNEGNIPLPDLTADEFRALIDFFLPYRCLARGEPPLKYWINLLSISTKYQLDSIRPIAIKGIDTYRPEIDPVEKHVLAAKYMIKEWEVSSFKILCQRPDPLTVEDAKKLGVVIVTEIFREREKIRSKPDTTDVQSASLPQPVITTPDQEPCTSEKSQSDATSTTSEASTATATTEPVANPPTVTPTPPNNTTVKSAFPKVMVPKVVRPTVKLPKAKRALSDDRGCCWSPWSENNNGRPTDFGSLFAPAPPLFSPPVSGKTTQVPSPKNTGNNSAGVFLDFAESGGSKPSSPASTTSKGQGDTLFSGVGTSDSLFTVKPKETQKTTKETALPTSPPKFVFTFSK